MHYKGLKLDEFQEEAIRSIEKNHSVVVSAPTGSGKTLIADYIIDRDLKKGIRVIYTAPIKALSNQKYKDFCRDYGEENIGLMTGDIVRNPGAPIIIMTTEIYRNIVVARDPIADHVSYVILDEIHYINDIERGTVWEESIIFSESHIRLLCLSATIPNADEFAAWIQAIKKHPVDVIRHDTRPVPLEIKFYDTELGITELKKISEASDIPDYRYIRGFSHHRRARLPSPNHVDLIREIQHKLPCIFFTFSRAGCQNKAAELAKKRLFEVNPKTTNIMRERLDTLPKEINLLTSTRLLRETLPHGIGFHHAGILPVLKDLVEELFAKGLIKVLYTTETFAVGVNMPAKTVCFESLRKFDGREFRFINSKEFFQIAGRAGRRGIDKEGFVFALINRRDFDFHRIRRMTESDTEPILSQFRLSVNTVLNLIKQHPHKEIDEIIAKNFHSFQTYGKDFGTHQVHPVHRSFDNLKRKLERMGYLHQNRLTEKGDFASNIYADELVLTEIFATDLYHKLNEFQMLMLVACICYEFRDVKFKQTYPSLLTKNLKRTLYKHAYLSRDPRFNMLDDLTAIIHPCYHGASIFDILKNTDMSEGDLLRYLRQILDRFAQLKGATRDRLLVSMIESCQAILNQCMKDVDML